jgi:hypothetical protein
VPTHWAVTPELSLEEESVIAYQAAITYFFHLVKEPEDLREHHQRGPEWDYTYSATLMRDQVKLLQDSRDKALAAAPVATRRSRATPRSWPSGTASGPPCWSRGRTEGSAGVRRPVIDQLIVLDDAAITVDRQLSNDPRPWDRFVYSTRVKIEDVYYPSLVN